MNEISKQKMLMNPVTGSVDCEETWLYSMPSFEVDQDVFTDQRMIDEERLRQFNSLIEVVRDEEEDWVEVTEQQKGIAK